MRINSMQILEVAPLAQALLQVSSRFGSSYSSITIGLLLICKYLSIDMAMGRINKNSTMPEV
jgi:hypothetical protein